MSTLDWMPTLCSIAGADCDYDIMEGEDMSDVWLGHSDRSRRDPLFWSLSARNKKPIAVLYDNWKLFADQDGDDVELYDLRDDPAEEDDVYDDNEEIGIAMAAKLFEWFDTLPSTYCHLDDQCNVTFPFDPRTTPIRVRPPPLLAAPSLDPTPHPTESPTIGPTPVPTTAGPSNRPSPGPTTTATVQPSDGGTTSPLSAAPAPPMPSSSSTPDPYDAVALKEGVTSSGVATAVMTATLVAVVAGGATASALLF